MSIEQRLERLERIMLLQFKNVLNVDDVAIILSVSTDRVRHLVSKRLIPTTSKATAHSSRNPKSKNGNCQTASRLMRKSTAKRQRT